MNELFDEYNLHQKFKAIIKSKPMKNSITKIATVITLLLCNAFYAQNIITVDNNVNSSANYTSLQTAIDNAQANDYIYLYPSETTYGNATCAKKLHFRGIGHTPEATNGIKGIINVLTFGTNASASSVAGLELTQINISAVVHNLVIENNKIGYISSDRDADNWVIRGNVIENQIISSTLSNNWQILNNYISGGNYYIFNSLRADSFVSNNIIVCTSGVSIFSNCYNVASNNLFLAQNATYTALNISGSASNVVFSNNLTYNTSGTTLATLPGTGNYNNTNPSFVLAPTLTSYSVTNDYHSSNATLLGTDGTTIGIYGLNFPFSKRGYSFSMPYIESMTILNPTIPANGTLQINLTAKSN